MRAIGIPDTPQKREHWLQVLQSTRHELEHRVFMQQEKIHVRVEEGENLALQRNRLVLIKRTTRELQGAHTKLTDKFDHLARVEQPLSYKVTYEITYLMTGHRDYVNHRNLKPFYEDLEDRDAGFEPLRYPALPFAKAEMR